MTKTTLYLKYRPQRIAELDSQKVREALQNIISSGQLPHAFLFSGPKGIGKTSAARILAKVVNCEANQKKLTEPCGKCSQCLSVMAGNNLDVIEMDAASNRGIDDIRALKEKIILAPGSARKKVYIIDEVHMLTTEAFNALLKTLEEPPNHVLFILATTDPQKLPETVKSRLTNIVFEKATEEELMRQLTRVTKGEKVKLGKDVLSLISQAADGSFRDAVKTLEQVLVSLKNLSREKVEAFLFDSSSFELEKLLEHLAQREITDCLALIEAAAAKGMSARKMIDRILERIHEALLAKSTLGKADLKDFNQEELIELTNFLFEARSQVGGPISQLPLETALLRWSSKDGDGKDSDPVDIEEDSPDDDMQKDEDLSSQKSVAEKMETENLLTAVPVKEVDEILWKQILVSTKTRNSSVEALLRAARPLGFDGKTLMLGVFYKFHKERLEAMENRRILEDVCGGVLGNSIKVAYTLTEREPLPEKKTGTQVMPEVSLTENVGEDIINAAKEVFGI